MKNYLALARVSSDEQRGKKTRAQDTGEAPDDDAVFAPDDDEETAHPDA